jgi:hypothetical protein
MALLWRVVVGLQRQVSLALHCLGTSRETMVCCHWTKLNPHRNLVLTNPLPTDQYSRGSRKRTHANRPVEHGRKAILSRNHVLRLPLYARIPASACRLRYLHGVAGVLTTRLVQLCCCMLYEKNEGCRRISWTKRHSDIKVVRHGK